MKCFGGDRQRLDFGGNAESFVDSESYPAFYATVIPSVRSIVAFRPICNVSQQATNDVL